MERKLIAILRGIKPDEAVDVTRAVIDGGISRIEVPLNSPDPLDSISRMVDRFGDKARIGAGTVTTRQEVDQVKKTGASFIVSPNCDTDVIQATKSRGMMSYPGVMTPSECFAALGAGADGLKFFPALLIGYSGLSAMRAVLPTETEVFMVGGVEPRDFAQWKKAGASGFGMGSNLYITGDGIDEIARKVDLIVLAYDAVAG